MQFSHTWTILQAASLSLSQQSTGNCSFSSFSREGARIEDGLDARLRGSVETAAPIECEMPDRDEAGGEVDGDEGLAVAECIFAYSNEASRRAYGRERFAVVECAIADLLDARHGDGGERLAKVEGASLNLSDTRRQLD